MEQMTVCEYCGTEIPHISASWADDGSSYCEGCHPREAQSEIARLQAEVERYEEQNRALLDDQITCACGYDDPNDVCGKHHPAFKRKLYAAYNDGIEAAANFMESHAYTTIGSVRSMEPSKFANMDTHHATAAAAIRDLKR